MKNLKSLAVLMLVVSGYLLIADEAPPSERMMAQRIATMQGLNPLVPGQPLYDNQTGLELADPVAYLEAIDELNALARTRPILYELYVDRIRDYNGNPFLNVVQLSAVMRNQLRTYRAIPNDTLTPYNARLVLHIIDNGNLAR